MNPDLILVTIDKDYGIIAGKLESLLSYGFLLQIEDSSGSSDGL